VDSKCKRRPGSRRRRLQPAAVRSAALALGLIVLGILPDLGARASAVPPDCEDGSPPPCEPPPDPDPDPDPNPNPPPGTGWSSLISVLDQSEGGYDEHVLGAWKSTGSPVYSTPSGTVQWNTPAQNQGRITVPFISLPAPLMGFQLREQDQDIDGPMCRSTPVPSVELVLATTHVLVADQDDTTQGELQNMADDFEGTVSIPESESGTYSATVQLHEVTLAADGATHTLPLAINGHLFVDGPGPFNVDGDFRYRGNVHLNPSKRAEVDQIVTATTSDDSLDIVDEDRDREAEILPAFRKAIAKKVSEAVNDKVAASPEAQFFTSLGFTVSFRDVTIDAEGLHVLPSLCKVG